jgi:DNA-binding HxlR family transcriptional regulator
MKKKKQRRSDCPINHALEMFGDTWSLLIVRDIVYFGKHTYGEFLESEEAIASNILADRLAWLEQIGILTKRQHPTDKRKEMYGLTERGLDLIPILIEMANWSAKNDPQTGAPPDWIAALQANRESMLALIRETVGEGGSIFVGEGSVIEKLAAGTEGKENKKPEDVNPPA